MKVSNVRVSFTIDNKEFKQSLDIPHFEFSDNTAEGRVEMRDCLSQIMAEMSKSIVNAIMQHYEVKTANKLGEVTGEELIRNE